MWLNVKIKRSPIFKKLPKSSHIKFNIWSDIFNKAPKVRKDLGYFWKKIWVQDLSKVAQSGNTASKVDTPTYK